MILQLQNNNNYLYLNIDQYGLYAGTMIPALVDISSQQPNYRPNFFEACHLFCATLIETPWYGFPNLLEMGSFSVYDGVIIPSCWRKNSHHLGDVASQQPPQRHSGDEAPQQPPQRHSGDEAPQQPPQRHSGDVASQQRHSGDVDPPQELEKGESIPAVSVDTNNLPLSDYHTAIEDILKAERITSQTPATAENTMYPRFPTGDAIPTNLDISPKAKFENFRSSGKDNSLIYGLVVLIVLLFLFIIVLQCVKKHKD